MESLTSVGEFLPGEAWRATTHKALRGEAMQTEVLWDEADVREENKQSKCPSKRSLKYLKLGE